MFSLKAYIPTLAPFLNVSPDALYERQRALIRSGLLVPVEGRGPGSGVKVSVPAVSILILSVFATESLADIDSTVRRLGRARAEKKSCPLTGSVEFGQALEIILAQANAARRISWVKVERPIQQATIVFDSKKRTISSSVFGEAGQKHGFQLTIEAKLSGFAVWCIANDLSDIANGTAVSAIEQRMQKMRSDPSERYLKFLRGER
jgi:hypothetical protein